MRRLRVPVGLEWELLIVNNNCTDDTDAVIARHQDALPLRRLFEAKPGHCNARNCAVAAARGDLIAWTDDDVLVDENWLAALVKAAALYPDALGFGGPIEPWFPVAPDPDYLAAFPAVRTGFCGIDHDLPEGGLPVDRAIFGANMAFRREVHLDYAFDPSIGSRPQQFDQGRSPFTLAVGGGDEIDLLRKIRSAGAQVVWVPTMRIKHYVDPHRMTFDYLRVDTMDRGRQSVRWQGLPSGKRVLGVPLWLLRAWLEVTAAYWYSHLRRNRRTALAKKYRQWQLTGMIKGCLDNRGEARRSRIDERKRGMCSELSAIRGD
jgi:glycosyltransferase involved in cell wall biosynthesis